MSRPQHPSAHARGFTLLEAAVSVAAVAGLLCILAPAAASSRAAARSGGCSANIGRLARAVLSHAGDTGSFMPSYVYGSSTTGTGWSMADQLDMAPNPANGIVHWSGVLLDAGYVASPDTFTCDAALRGSAPASNPGAVAADWEPGQVDTFGQTGPAVLPSDRQAKRMAYTANGAIMPRNKLVQGSPRKNRIVPLNEVPSIRDRETDSPVVVTPSNITRPSSTILLTEFFFSPTLGWRSIGSGPSGSWVCKSYRPVTPFLGTSVGTSVYSEPMSGTFARFFYPEATDLYSTTVLGQASHLLDGGNTELNAVGRHHTGETANFARVDGSVRQSTVQQTIVRREWGERFHSITGPNAVRP